MIISRRLDVLDLRVGSEYLKYFKGLEEVLEKISDDDYRRAYTDTYCIDSSWVPLYLMVYIPHKDKPEIIYSGKNCEVTNEYALNDAKSVLENFLNKVYKVDNGE